MNFKRNFLQGFYDFQTEIFILIKYDTTSFYKFSLFIVTYPDNLIKF